ncbi:hypothetical protein FRB98_009019 [Tulasnella sp. 332]|nr:hypothetical protein FRB98_009019 [Tulasnella sp. 332]
MSTLEVPGDKGALDMATQDRTCVDAIALQQSMVSEAKRHNASLPIHRLVTEVFIEIFLYYVDTKTSTIPKERIWDRAVSLISKHYARVKNITLVSTTWADLAFDTPELWHYIHRKQSPDDLLNSLTRSKSYPLLIQCCNGQSIDERVQDDEELVPFVERANRDIHQRETEKLKISDARAQASKLLLSYIEPLLSYIELLLPSIDLNPRSVKELPLNRTLNATTDRWDPRINWGSPQMANLETLTLYGEISAESPSASRLAQLLRASSRLIRLEICYDMSVKEAAPTHTPPIELPALTVLDMEVSPVVATYIFTVVRIPACETFNLVVVSPKNTFLPDALQHHASVLASRIASCSFADISVSEHDFHYKAGEVFSIRLVTPESHSDSLTWVVNHIHAPTLSVPTRLIIRTHHFPLSAPAMQPLASVMKLRCTTIAMSFTISTFTEPELQDLVHHLSQAITVEGVYRFPLSGLLELSLNTLTEPELQDLIQMVESRLGDVVKLQKLVLLRARELAKGKVAKAAEAASKKLTKLVDTHWSPPGVTERVLSEHRNYDEDSYYNPSDEYHEYDDYDDYSGWSSHDHAYRNKYGTNGVY